MSEYEFQPASEETKALYKKFAAVICPVCGRSCSAAAGLAAHMRGTHKLSLRQWKEEHASPIQRAVDRIAEANDFEAKMSHLDGNHRFGNQSDDDFEGGAPEYPHADFPNRLLPPKRWLNKHYPAMSLPEGEKVCPLCEEESYKPKELEPKMCKLCRRFHA